MRTTRPVLILLLLAGLGALSPNARDGGVLHGTAALAAAASEPAAQGRQSLQLPVG